MFLAPIGHTKAASAEKILNRFNLCFKHAAVLSLDVDLQVTAKALLGKQRYRTTNRPAMDWRNISAFYKILCETTSITHLASRFLILTGRSTDSLRHIHKEQIDGAILDNSC
ncbi:hypothetical protein O9A_01388 [Bartonella koehlerae C-29]|uniref:Uncharacterized protein n=1 Tax=Bartonella koehlerae C-29 TaxID=1134510 RepID=A0A067W4V0_9HYPH|nr:hypothetical protein O9A_01388 [Bartonella koehlerae C-29]